MHNPSATHLSLLSLGEEYVTHEFIKCFPSHNLHKGLFNVDILFEESYSSLDLAFFVLETSEVLLKDEDFFLEGDEEDTFVVLSLP